MSYTLFFDGSYEKKEKTGSYGWVLYSQDNLIIRQGYGECLLKNKEEKSNNLAEYIALIKALEYLFNRQIKINNLICKGDSKLVVEQVNGRLKCRTTHLYKLMNRVRTLLSQVSESWNLEWIPRRDNKVADSLSKRVYKKK